MSVNRLPPKTRRPKTGKPKTGKQKRRSPGVRVAQPLVEWLNRAMKEAKEENNQVARESLEHVLTFLVDLGDYTKQRTQLDRAFKEEAIEAITEEWVSLVADRHFDVDDALARYEFAATVYGPNDLRFRGQLRSGAQSFRYDVDGLVYYGGFGEPDAILAVFELAKQKYLPGVRACQQCLRFFYSSKSNRLYCSRRCGVRHCNATPKARAARKLAKKNYSKVKWEEARKYRGKRRRARR